MDAFSYAVRKVIRGDIPKRILTDAFLTEDRYNRRGRSLEAAIVEEVILAKVMPDINSIGGLQVDVPLSGLGYQLLDNNERVYKIPLGRTQNRKINQVMSISLNVTNNFAERNPGQTHNTYYVAPIERSIQRVINSWRPMPNIRNAHVELIGDNVIKIRDYQNFSSDTTLRCLVEYSPDFGELKSVYFEDFSRLVKLAVKSYIYTNLVLEVEQMKIDGGRELGKYAEFVDQYSEMETSYEQLLDEKWTQILLLNDQQRKDQHLFRAGTTTV